MTTECTTERLEFGGLRRQRVVGRFDGAERRLGLVRCTAGVDEYADHDRNFAAVDEVVHHVVCA